MAKKKQPENLEKLCLRKWFLNEYKGIRLSAEEGFSELGLEGGLETAYDLLENGTFLIKAFNEEQFFLFATFDKGENYEMIFDSGVTETERV